MNALQVDLSLRNKAGETALMCAARFGSKQVTRMLLEHLRQLELDGYFLRQRNRFGLTALELARAENLDAAKVLTKHLISFGQHTGALLARSGSHHQLVVSGSERRGQLGAGRASRAACPSGQPAGQRPVGERHLFMREQVASPADCYSLASELSSDGEPALLGPARSTGQLHQVVNRAAAAAGSAAFRPYFDPKAAEFSAYLLEQQQQVGAGQERRANAAPPDSDDSDDNQLAYLAPGPGQLMRSRSCLLGPSSSGAGQPPAGKQAAKKAQAGARQAA